MRYSALFYMVLWLLFGCKQGNVIKEKVVSEVNCRQNILFDCFINGANFTVKLDNENNEGVIILNEIVYNVDSANVRNLNDLFNDLRHRRVVGVVTEEPSVDLSGGNINSIICIEGDRIYEYPVDKYNHTTRGKFH